MNKIEKYIIAVITLIAVGAIGTAIYFGVNKTDEVSNKGNNVEINTNNQESLGDQEDSYIDNAEVYSDYIYDSKKNIAKYWLGYGSKDIMLNGNKHRIYMDNNSMKVYFDDKHIYTMDRFSGLGYVYVLGDIFMFADYGSCSTIGLKIFDENKELNIEPLNWDDNVIKYNFSTIEKIEIENSNPVIYYTFDAADCGAEISLANGEKFNPNFAESEELGIKGDQIISGNAKITYLGNKKFSEVQVLTGKTYSEIFE